MFLMEDGVFANSLGPADASLRLLLVWDACFSCDGNERPKIRAVFAYEISRCTHFIAIVAVIIRFFLVEVYLTALFVSSPLHTFF